MFIDIQTRTFAKGYLPMSSMENMTKLIYAKIFINFLDSQYRL
jgi:hypothetical protein